MERMTQEQRVLADAAQANKLNIVHHAYVDISGDLVAGALLGQILFWFGRGKDGASRARIEKDGYLWIAKARGDWWDEIRITPKQYDRAAKILKEKNFIEIRTMKFNGNPTTHIRIIPETINSELDRWKWEQVRTMFPDAEKPAAAGYSPLGNNGITHRVTTELPEGEARYSPLGNNDVYQSGITSYTENTYRGNSIEHTHTGAAVQPQESVPSVNADMDKHCETKAQLSEDFERCWSEYPKKEGKQKALRAFERAVRRGGITPEQILAEVVLFAQYCERRVLAGELDRRYIPSGGTWFEGERWNDEIPVARGFTDYVEASNYRRVATELRRSAREGDKARFSEIMAALML